jgi:putative transposase
MCSGNSRPERIKEVEAGRKDLPVTPQCALLHLSRAAVYRKPKPVSAADLELMRLIDEQYLKTPFYGARKMAVVLSRSGHQVGRKRVMRLTVCCCCRCEHVGNASDAEVRILPPQDILLKNLSFFGLAALLLTSF